MMAGKTMGIKGHGAVDADGRRQGPWEFAYTTGERYGAGNFSDGVRVGVWTYWYRNGVVAGRGENLDSGATDVTGPWVYYHPNGVEAMRVTYDDIGFETGECREWYNNGQLACVTHYEMSDENGPITLWHPNGTKMAEGEVECDTDVGTWRYWHDNGQLAFVEVKDEVEPREGYFDRDGHPVSHKEFWAANLDVFRSEHGRSIDSGWPDGFARVDIWEASADLLKELGVTPRERGGLLYDLLHVERRANTSQRKYRRKWRGKGRW